MTTDGAILAGLEAGKRYRVVVPQKLALGKSIDGQTQPGLFRTYIPSTYGGTVTFETTAGTVFVSAPDGSPAKDAAGNDVTPGAKVEFDVPQGAHGWYGLVVNGAASYTVSASFRIEGHSVDTDGSMLVPWHFFYFPFTDVVKQGQNHPSAKYDQQFSTTANAWERTSYWRSVIDSNNTRPGGRDGHAITEEFCDEINQFNEQNNIDYEYKYADCWWWGHCDAAASASALFKQPQASGNFTESDLEYLATEVAMRGYKLDLRFFLGGLSNSSRQHPSHTEIPEGEAGQPLDKDVGNLFEQLIKVVKHEGGVALVDMRASYKEGQDRSTDVWNQAVYRFSMEMVQAVDDGPGKDENETARGIAFKTILFANADKHPSSGDPEANPGTGWERHVDAVVHFGENGRIDPNHPENNCTKCHWPGNFNDIYLPRYIFKINGLQQGGSGNGNPEVDLGHVHQLGVQLRGVFGG
jgi:hypothetical protein